MSKLIIELEYLVPKQALEIIAGITKENIKRNLDQQKIKPTSYDVKVMD